MLDARFVRENIDVVKTALERRNAGIDLTEFLGLEDERLRLLRESEELRNKRNVVSEEIGKLKREKKNADQLVKDMKGVADRIKEIDEVLKGIEEKTNLFLLTIPNIPNQSVPVGKD